MRTRSPRRRVSPRSNARLQAEVRAQIAELEASRRRLLAAGDDERRRLEQRLETTAERRLTRLLDDLEQAHRVARADPERRGSHAPRAEQLERSLADVRASPPGFTPASWPAAGWPARSRRSPRARRCPSSSSSRCRARSAEAERTAYFVCSEALANVAKYADASRARVNVGSAGGRLRVEVGDDGRGGADPGAGTGLRGLADRVEALGGALAIDSRPGGGTRLVAELPLTGPS